MKFTYLFFIIMLSVTVLYAEENQNQNQKSSNKYTFSYDQDIPTLIRYGDKVSGYMSKTGYFGFNLWDNSRSRSSFDIGYNITFYELQESPSIGKLISIFGFGYIPFLELLALPGFILDKKEKGAGFGMISSVAGYSCSRQLLDWFRLGFSIHGGPVYCAKIKPWDNREEFDRYFEKQNNEMWYDYDKWVIAYEAMGNIAGKWGARINPKVKFYFLNSSDDTLHIGLGFGYVQYIFANNHFNSYDIGLDFTIAF